MSSAMSDAITPQRAEVLRYVGLDLDETTVRATYDVDGRIFHETVVFEGVEPLNTPAARAVAELWFLVAGLSYYKTGAARRIDVGTTPLGAAGRHLLEAALRDGLGEFSYRNELTLSDVTIAGGGGVDEIPVVLDPQRVLVPFGGGIDSVVTVESLSPDLDASLFIVSPSSGRFAPLEATAAQTGLPIVRATRHLDEQLLASDDNFFNGHVPVTAMVTLLCAMAAVASGRGGVVMSNEHSASVPNLVWSGREINHQWSKSLAAEVLIAEALDERLSNQLTVASLLRARSEVWVAQVFSQLPQYHHVFRSCNRAFRQSVDQRVGSWCGECDKCLFINLVLAPHLSRSALRDIFGHEPLSDPARDEQLRVLVGRGVEAKPFECVGDPDESAVALQQVSHMTEWRDVPRLVEIASDTSSSRSFEELLQPQGTDRVPTHWLR
jgi:UDP-N-acetyl-alpha-D-muramoyl-L-alanyl-L-glutamate epimerase